MVIDLVAEYRGSMEDGAKKAKEWTGKWETRWECQTEKQRLWTDDGQEGRGCMGQTRFDVRCGRRG
jgi:hypothetical protein